MRAGAPYYSGTITTRAVTTAQGTTGLADLVLPGDASTLFDAGGATVAVTNGGDQTITALSLLFTDTLAGGGASISYAASSVSVAAGATGTYYVATNAGILRLLDAEVTYTTAPTAGRTVTVKVILQGH